MHPTAADLVQHLTTPDAESVGGCAAQHPSSECHSTQKPVIKTVSDRIDQPSLPSKARRKSTSRLLLVMLESRAAPRATL